MAIKISSELFGRVKQNGEQNIYIRLYRNKKNAYIETGHTVVPKFFDIRSGLISSHPDKVFQADTNAKITELISKYNKIISLLGAHADVIEMTKLKQLVLAYSVAPTGIISGSQDFYASAQQYINELTLDNRQRHAATIQTTVTQLRNFHGEGLDLHFPAIDVNFLKSFRRWYVPDHGKVVTFNKHLRNIKLIFNEARRNKVINRDLYPFDDFQIPSNYNADIRCYDAETIYRISQTEGFGRDMFMLTFYLCGMNMIDIVSIPYATDHIEVERKKTSRSANNVKLRLKIHPKAREIIRKYADPEKKYLVRFYYASYLSIIRRANLELKKTATAVGIDTLSLTYARHSFATIAGECKIPDYVIDKALMHTGKGMIEKYRRFDYSIVDDALAKVIKAVDAAGKAPAKKAKASSGR